jgi:uroporphyrinogen decarboxylase-like protein
MTLTPKQRIMRLMNREPIDAIPWFPRIDLWYNFHKRQNSLPPGYRMGLDDIIAKLGGGIYKRGVSIYRERLQNLDLEICYSDPAWKQRIESADTGLNRNYILSLVLQTLSSAESNVTATYKTVDSLGGSDVLVTLKTPRGDVSAKFRSSELLQEAGIRPVQSEYFIKDITQDIEPVKYIIDNIVLEPTFDQFRQVEDKLGEAGVVWARTSPYYSPMHQLMWIYMGPEQTFLDLYDHRDRLEKLMACIEEHLKKVQSICLESPAQFIAHGGNFDATMTSPQHFKTYFIPYFAAFAEKLHARSKYLAVHADGEMNTLMDIYTQAKTDIAEGFTPAPMTRVSFKQAIDQWTDKVIIWGGIPASLLSKDVSETEFDAFIGDLLAQGKRYPFVLSMGDNTPIDADIHRLERISERVNNMAL